MSASSDAQATLNAKKIAFLVVATVILVTAGTAYERWGTLQPCEIMRIQLVTEMQKTLTEVGPDADPADVMATNMAEDFLDRARRPGGLEGRTMEGNPLRCTLGLVVKGLYWDDAQELTELREDPMRGPTAGERP